MKKIFTLLIITTLLLTTVVVAIGSSTRTRQTTNVTVVAEPQIVDCDSRADLRERIKCRLEQETVETTEIYGRSGSYEGEYEPEACRGTDNPERCRQLYSKITSCYDLGSRAKHTCLQSSTGVTRAILAGENRNETVVRDYLVALLYDLQGRAEEAQESGEITTDEAAEIIEQIVNIKKSILDGAGRPRIKTLIGTLRSLWRGAFE